MTENVPSTLDDTPGSSPGSDTSASAVDRNNPWAELERELRSGRYGKYVLLPTATVLELIEDVGTDPGV